MELYFLGTGGWHSTYRAQTPCTFLPQYNIFLDFGSGFLQQNHLLEGKAAILLSHYHDDHTDGLRGLKFYLRTEKLAIYGKPGLINFLKNYFGQRVPQKFEEHPFPIESIEIADNCFYFNGCKIESKLFEGHPVDHSSVLSFKLTLPKGKLVYLTDLPPSKATLDWAKGSRWLIHDCYLPNQKNNEFTTPAVLGKFALEAGIEKLFVVHAHPRVERKGRQEKMLSQIKELFPDVYAPKDNERVEF